jgi:hypothetical protein
MTIVLKHSAPSILFPTARKCGTDRNKCGSDTRYSSLEGDSTEIYLRGKPSTAVLETRFYEIQGITIKSLIYIFICGLFNEVVSQSAQCQMVRQEVSNKLLGRWKEAVIRTLRQLTRNKRKPAKNLSG